MTAFDSLGLSESMLMSVEAHRFETPTPIQVRSIPLIAVGHDVSAEAETGSGKTAAFALPVLDKVARRPQDTPAVLVMAPTRELALQVASAFSDFARYAGQKVRVLAVIGGEPIEAQQTSLQRGVDIVVATPGRLLDLHQQANIDLSGIHTLILDEADKLLDGAFADELLPLIEATPASRQTLLFSATLPAELLDLAARLQNSPVLVRLSEAPAPVGVIKERSIQVDRHQRRALLQHLLSTEAWDRTLVFVATQRAADNLAAKLRVAGVWAASLHGGLDQPDRIKVLRRFKRGATNVLVATDLAARGIDIPSLAAVINYDLPRSPAEYTHRIGRTGRAGKPGTAVSFVDHETEAHMRLIEKRAGHRVPRESIEGFELTAPRPPKQKGPPPTKGKRKSKKDKLREKAAREAASKASPSDDV